MNTSSNKSSAVPSTKLVLCGACSEKVKVRYANDGDVVEVGSSRIVSALGGGGKPITFGSANELKAFAQRNYKAPLAASHWGVAGPGEVAVKFLVDAHGNPASEASVARWSEGREDLWRMTVTLTFEIVRKPNPAETARMFEV